MNEIVFITSSLVKYDQVVKVPAGALAASVTTENHRNDLSHFFHIHNKFIRSSPREVILPT